MTTTRTPAEPEPARHGGHPGDDGEGQRPGAAGVQTTGPSTSGLAQLTRVLGAVVAPTTLLTSLLFYFGWSRAYWFYIYFGVNSTLLDLTTRDYVQISLDALFVPITVVAFAGLLVLWGHAMLRVRLSAGSEPRLLRVGIPAMAAAGAVLATAGLWSVFAPTWLDSYLGVAPISLALGVVLLVYAGHLGRLLTVLNAPAGRAAAPQWAAVAEWAVVFVLVGLSLFWCRDRLLGRRRPLASATGRGRAAGRAQRRDLQPAEPEPARPGRAGDALPGPGGGLPVPLRRPEARAAVGGPVPVPARGVDP